MKDFWCGNYADHSAHIHTVGHQCLGVQDGNYPAQGDLAFQHIHPDFEGDMDLTSFRTDAAPAPTQPPTERPTLGHGEVLAFDQSITATGWIHLVSGRGGLHVRDVGSISCPPDGYPKGHAGTLLRAEYVAEQMAAILRRVPVLDVVHELPAVGGRMARPESSLMAALALRIEARRQGHGVHIVQNQHSKKVLVGNGNATKPEWHAGISKFTWDGPTPTNEGQRDAFCLGLTYLLEHDSKDA